MKDPLVSVIVNCHNGEKYLRLALASIEAQYYEHLELLFVDNNSTDDSLLVFREFSERDSRFKYLRLDETVTLGEARQIGVNNSVGEIICFLDVDDIWEVNKLELQIKSMITTNSDISYANLFFIDRDGNNIGRSRERRVKNDLKSNLIRYRINLPTLAVRRFILSKYELNFDVQIHASEEYCLVMQLLARGARVHFLEQTLAHYRLLDDSLTVKKLEYWSIDRRYTLNKIEREVPAFLLKYKKYVDFAWSVGDYYEALYLISTGDEYGARKVISNTRSKSILFCFFGIALHPFFINITKKLLNLKYKRGVFL
jgi:glycosyltransferase involved in cell wall biosynthesis